MSYSNLKVGNIFHQSTFPTSLKRYLYSNSISKTRLSKCAQKNAYTINILNYFNYEFILTCFIIWISNKIFSIRKFIFMCFSTNNKKNIIEYIFKNFFQYVTLECEINKINETSHVVYVHIQVMFTLLRSSAIGTFTSFTQFYPYRLDSEWLRNF